MTSQKVDLNRVRSCLETISSLNCQIDHDHDALPDGETCPFRVARQEADLALVALGCSQGEITLETCSECGEPEDEHVTPRIVDGRCQIQRRNAVIPKATTVPGSPKPMSFSKKNLADLAKAEETVEYGDLYDHLHRVGDDTTKAEIEQALLTVLDPAMFRKVVAVFKVAVSDDV